MNRIKTRNKRKLLLEFLHLENAEISINELVSEKKIHRLKYNNIRTVIIQSSIPVEPSIYIRLINEFARLGFEVRTNHLDTLGHEELETIRLQVQEIYESLKEGGCLVISYGKSYALPLVCSFFIFSGYSIDDAIDFSNSLNSNFKLNEMEESFIYSFQDYINDKRLNGHGIRIKNNITQNQQPQLKTELEPAEKIHDINEDTEDDSAFDKIGTEEQAVSREVIGTSENILQLDDEKGLSGSILPVREVDLAAGEKETITPPEDDKLDFTDSKDISVVREDLKTDENLLAETEEVTEIQDDKTEIVAVPVVTKTEEEPHVKRFEDKEDLKEEGDDKPASVAAGPFYTSIRFKLVSIISVIIIASLTGMIFLASYFFKQDNTIRVQENNHKISELIGLKALSDINTLVDKSKFLISAKLMGRKGESFGNAEKSLSDDSDIVFIGITEKRTPGGAINFSSTLANKKLLNEMQVQVSDITDALTVSSSELLNAFDGDRLIQNMSQGFEGPVVGLSVPYLQNENREVLSVLVIVVKFDQLVKTFKTTGIINPVMLNDRGDVIGHPDSNLVKSGSNWRSFPLVKVMVESKLDNGLTRFRDDKGVYFLGSFKKIGFGGAGVIAFTEEKLALQEVYNIQRRNLYLMIAVLSCAVLIVFFFGKSLTKPIIKLLQATNFIKEGQYRVDIKPTSNDEIGQLTASFIEMGKGLEEREKMKDAFGKFVNKDIAERVLRGEISLGGEKKTAAIFFSDIRAFTSISEKLKPEEVVEFLNEYMTRMVRCVNVTDGVVDKYIGDAIMAEWGVPISKGNDTERAVNAALMMRQELLEFNSGRGGDKKPIIKIGCGINTGDVLAGQIGSEDRMEYTVIGDAVNLASRIESLNKPFGTDILISQDSYSLVKDIFNVEKMSLISVKGKSEKQQIFAVLGRKDDPKAPKTIEEVRKLVGIEKMDFKRRQNDDEDEPEEETKYEIFHD